MDAFKRLTDRIRTLTDEMGIDDGEEVFFRGNGQASYPLSPSLLREKANRKLNDDDTRWLESSLYFEFRARAQELQQQPLDSWDWLFMMRHHRLPSRLLDWTEVLGFALFFALEKWTPGSDRRPCVWLLNPYQLNEENWGVRDLVLPEYLSCEYDEDDRITDEHEFVDYLAGYWEFEFDKPVAIYPQQKSRRQHAQRGWFTVHGNDDRPIEITNPNCVRRIDLDDETAAACREVMGHFGIDNYLVYPDLDNLSQALFQKYVAALTPRPPKKDRPKEER